MVIKAEAWPKAPKFCILLIIVRIIIGKTGKSRRLLFLDAKRPRFASCERTNRSRYPSSILARFSLRFFSRACGKRQSSADQRPTRNQTSFPFLSAFAFFPIFCAIFHRGLVWVSLLFERRPFHHHPARSQNRHPIVLLGRRRRQTCQRTECG
jgi:hypothetical protein